MTGERLVWFKLASHLGMSLQRCMAETTSTEFSDWQTYFQEDLNYPAKGDYYLAQIAAEIRRWMSKTPETVRVEHFLLKFNTGAKRKMTAQEVKDRVESSKARWRAFLHGGRKRDGNGG